jgi:hypothetical protein
MLWMTIGTQYWLVGLRLQWQLSRDGIAEKLV